MDDKPVAQETDLKGSQAADLRRARGHTDVQLRALAERAVLTAGPSSPEPSSADQHAPVPGPSGKPLDIRRAVGHNDDSLTAAAETAVETTEATSTSTQAADSQH